MLLSGAARADDLCAPGAKHHGKPIDLDLKDADIHDVLRLLVDVGRINLVVADDVTGKVTVHLKKVAWDSAACAIAATHALKLNLDGTILLATKR